jgi:hypothetical protein
MLGGYQEIKNKVKNLQKHIEEELARNWRLFLKAEFLIE